MAKIKNGIIINCKVYEAVETTDKEVPCGLCDLLGICTDDCKMFNSTEHEDVYFRLHQPMTDKNNKK